MATAAELQSEIRRLQERYRIAQNGLTTLNRNLQSNQAILARYTAEVSTIPGQVAALESQINAIQVPPPVTASQAASDDGPQGPNKSAAARVTNGRIVAPPDTSSPSTADVTVTSNTGGETGTNAPVRTTEQTQATNGYDQGINIYTDEGTLSNFRRNPETGLLYDASGLPGGVDLKTSPGVAAPPDDAKNNSTSTVQATTNAASNALKIQARPNPLDQFASYTYSISVYLLSADQYTRLLRGKTKKIDGYFLLFQDGGAPVNRGGPKDNMGIATNISASDSGRNPFFPNDYYIDSLTLDTSPLGKATGASHMTASMKMTVNEPNGITLIDNLYSAVANLQQKDGSGKVNYTAADYLAVIRFYGQGADGNPVQVRASGGAAIEKFIPFKLAAINWSVGSKMVSYEWDCVPQGLLIAGYTARGAVPHDVQLASTTVGKLLGGNSVYAGTAPNAATPGQSTTATQGDRDRAIRAADEDRDIPKSPAKAVAAPTSKKTITQGLMAALTEFQEELTKPQKGQSVPIFDIADRYFIRFVDGIGYDGKKIPASAIENAKITIPQTKTDQRQTAMGPPAAGKGGSPEAIEPNKQAVDNASRTFSITAGQMITQAIDLAIRNSTYILDQALVMQNSDGLQIPNPDKRNSPMSWFNIIMNAEPRPGGIDPKRNDHAFDITYTIKPYRLQNFNSKYFPPSRFAGVHKSYPYWFTGQNTAVVEYQETLNALYSITVSGSDPKNSGAARIRELATASLRDIAKYNYAVTSGQSTQGSADTRLNETAANAADYLFSPGDLANAKIKILGDPDWIQQGSLFKQITPGQSEVADVTGFGEDGSISFETGDVLFEIVWQRPEDYDLATGVADPYSGGYRGVANKSREPIQSRVYTAVKVLSEFRQGSFYQTIEGTLYQFPLPSKKNTVNATAASTTSDSLDNARASNTGAQSNGARTTANQFPGRGRTGIDLQNRIQGTATTDPRSLLSADGGTAAILGAQQASASQPIPRSAASNTGTGIDINGLDDTTTSNIRPAAPPQAPTDGTDNTISVTAPINPGPRKLPGVGEGQPGLTDVQLAQLQDGIPADSGDPTSSTNPSNQDIATDGG
jgi:hypothetical protein